VTYGDDDSLDEWFDPGPEGDDDSLKCLGVGKSNDLRYQIRVGG
jgi:hypothetical protein